MFMMSYEDLHDIDLEPVVTASYTTRTVFISFTTPGETAGAAFANGADAIADLFRMLDARPGAHVAGWRSCIPEMLTA